MRFLPGEKSENEYANSQKQCPIVDISPDEYYMDTDKIEHPMNSTLEVFPFSSQQSCGEIVRSEEKWDRDEHSKKSIKIRLTGVEE